MAKFTRRLSLMFLFDHQHMEALAANDCFCTFSISWKIYWKCLHTTDKELKFMQNFMGWISLVNPNTCGLLLNLPPSSSLKKIRLSTDNKSYSPHPKPSARVVVKGSKLDENVSLCLVLDYKSWNAKCCLFSVRFVWSCAQTFVLVASMIYSNTHRNKGHT